MVVKRKLQVPWGLQMCFWLAGLLFTARRSEAQAPRANYFAADGHALQIASAAPDTLARRLTAPFSNNAEKVRAIFRWITDNIAYNVAVYPRTPHNRGFKDAVPEYFDEAIEAKSLDERVAYSVLQKKAALCNGYARLFKTLCQYAGIRAEIITGYARTNMGSGRFRSNHTWNAVYIDSAWYLLDATWASGVLSYRGDVFVKDYNDFYFLTPPEQMIRTHYPEDLRWTLLPQPPPLSEYRRAPFHPTAFIKYAITAYRPATGIIEAAVGDTLRFELESNNIERDRTIAADGMYDSTLHFSGSSTWAFLYPNGEKIAEKTVYEYIVRSADVQWLHLMYNNDAVLRYHLRVRQQPVPGTDISAR